MLTWSFEAAYTLIYTVESYMAVPSSLNCDNKNWLKWIVVSNKNGEMVLDTEDVPINEYQVQPPEFTH